MVNKELFDLAVKSAGVTYEHIAGELGISGQALRNKRSGKTLFYAREVAKISTILRLSAREEKAIFFASKVAETSTKKGATT